MNSSLVKLQDNMKWPDIFLCNYSPQRGRRGGVGEGHLKK